MAQNGSRPINSSAAFPLLLVVMATFLGCAGPKVTPPFSKPDVYRSDERILHRLKPGETPQSLAGKYLGEARRAWMVEDANPENAFQPGRLVVIPLVIQNRAGITEKGYQTVPILCYHRFADACDSPLCMPADIFEQQLRYLKENGIPGDQPRRSGCISESPPSNTQQCGHDFRDDGYRSVYQVAYPLLKKYGFTATLFVYIDYVGISSQAVTWDQLRELKQNGFYIGSHSVAHTDLSKQQKK
jgi:hypothetical protein